MARKSNKTVEGVTYDPVDEYEERPDAQRDREETLVAEGRLTQVDQIEVPETLKPGPAHDPEVVAQLRESATAPDKELKAEAKAVAKAEKEEETG